MTAFIRRHWSMIVNIFLVAVLGRYTFVKAMEAWQAQEFNFVEVVFAAHNIVMLTAILVRQAHVSIDRNAFHQAIALGAFFSGIAFVKHPTEGLAWAPEGIMVAALILGIAALASLGRSFGILIAVRKVKTGGVYRVVRHPMYLTDILWRVGYVAGNLCWVNALIFAGSTACYVYRALLEEKFLRQFPEYREYSSRVRYRMVPGIF